MGEEAGRRGPGAGQERRGPAAVPVATALAGGDGGLLTAWGEEARTLLGYEAAEVLGRPAAALLAAPLPGLALRRVSARTAWSGPAALRHRDGHTLVVRLALQPLTAADGTLQWTLTAEPPDPADLEVWSLAQLPIAVAVYDEDVRLSGANAAMEHMVGKPLPALRGQRLGEFVDGGAFEELDHLQEQVMRTGQPACMERLGIPYGETGEHAYSISVHPVRDETGAVRGVSTVVCDTTDQYLSRRRLDIVNEASTRIGTTLDVTRTAQELADIAVRRFADMVSVDLLDSVMRGEEPGQVPRRGDVVFRRVAQQSVLPGCPESAVAVGDPDIVPDHSPAVRAMLTGKGTLHSMEDDDLRRWRAYDPVRARAAVEYGIHSIMIVPLSARGTTLGLALFLRHRTADPFDADDLLLAEEIAARAAVCVDNARRYSRERATALTLQRTMLPLRSLRTSALEVATRYLPANSRAGVCGDWFDVIPLSGARVALVVGDVVGHGVGASAAMGRLRTAVRTLADVDLAPDELLTQLDDLVVRCDPEFGTGVVGGSAAEVGATCLYAVYDPVAHRCTVARAGHPPLAVVLPGGRAEFPEQPVGLPLGLGGLPFETVELDLPEGSVLALYTDGLIGSVRGDIDTGLVLLRRALTRPARTLEETCDNVLYGLLPERPRDDVALLTARTRALNASQVATWYLSADPSGVAAARRTVADQMGRWGLDEAAFTTELVVSELVTNAIRYAAGPIQLRLIRDAALICEVSDTSSTAPHLRRARTFDEGGRGLLLVARLTDRWGTRQTPAGKTIWAEQALA
ncbi:SpoIIE family protein phosphatase [Streptomyces sp. MI02-7b]|uniref:SpoIIE family protein phosphatase n=1 Tax=Streptomyces sp. MI02-7b TaxID=462941 RepID=UPI0029B42363|nr:SpoIIE family protein phosphatase [Streptomyces sp. MI02-7b]MDX3076206.1 SpoIIE family protein phosphatase [Streptomyces sp. MI02-7b]